MLFPSMSAVFLLPLCVVFLLLRPSHCTSSSYGDAAAAAAAGAAAPEGGRLLFCADRHPVKVSADEFRIPWSGKEHHFEEREAPSSITCTIKEPTRTNKDFDGKRNFSEHDFDDSNYQVEWLFYREYVTLDELEKNYKRIKDQMKESELSQPCRMPAPLGAHNSRSPNRVAPCEEVLVRDVDVTVTPDARRDDDGERVRSSTLTFRRGNTRNSGTYLCQWRWGYQQSRCIFYDENTETFNVTSGLHHSWSRSGTLYVKVYRNDDNQGRDLAVAWGASAALAIVVAALWCSDRHIRALRKGGGIGGIGGADGGGASKPEYI